MRTYFSLPRFAIVRAHSLIFFVLIRFVKLSYGYTVQYMAERYHFFLRAQSLGCVLFNNCVIYFKCTSSCRKFNCLLGEITNFSIIGQPLCHEVNLCMIFHIGHRKKISLFHIFVKILHVRDVASILMAL